MSCLVVLFRLIELPCSFIRHCVSSLFQNWPAMMKLTAAEVKAFRPVKYFKENFDKINSLSYTDSGEAVISSSDDDQMIMYDCNTGT